MKTPVKGAFIGLVANVVFNLILIKPMGHAGIALASGLAAGLNCAYLYYKMRDYRYRLKDNILFVSKLLFACLLMGGATYGIYLSGLNIIPVIVIGGILYFASLRITGIKIKEIIR